MSFLEIKNLHVKVEDKEIIHGINLKLEKGKVYALMGPNGSGKSTLANVLMGSPKYKITSGEILFEGENITNFPVNERAKKGLFISFQNPIEVSGITISNFLRTAYNSIKKKKLSFLEFQRLLEKNCEELNLDKEFLMRYLNEGFSGGEKKKIEILQLLVLNPKLVVLDETDSGLDMDSLKVISEKINKFMSEEKCILIITHYRRILDYINPDKIFIMNKGEIILEGEKDIIDKIEQKGYVGVK